MANNVKNLVVRMVQDGVDAVAQAFRGVDRTAAAASDAIDNAAESTREVGQAAVDAEKVTAAAMRRFGLQTIEATKKRVAVIEEDNRRVQESTLASEEQKVMAARDAARQIERLNARIARETEGAFSRSARSVEGFFQRAARAAAPISRAAGVGMTAALGAGGFAVQDLAGQAFEIEKGVIAAGLDPKNAKDLQRFQELAFAANAKFGFEADKTGEVLKDLNDKIGDFTQTGGGAFLDFVEVVGAELELYDVKLYKKLNPERQKKMLQDVAARMLADTNNPLTDVAKSQEGVYAGGLLTDLNRQAPSFDASAYGTKDSIQLLKDYVATIESTNPTAQKVAFYMENIATDSQFFYELLKENNKELDRLTSLLPDASLFTPEDLDTFREAREQMAILKVAFAGFILAVAESGLIDAFVKITKQVGDFVILLTQYVNPEVLLWVVGIGAVLTYMAPLLKVMGGLVKGLRSGYTWLKNWYSNTQGISALLASIRARLVQIGAKLALMGATIIGWLPSLSSVLAFFGAIWGAIQTAAAAVGAFLAGIGFIPLAIAAVVIGLVTLAWIFRDELIEGIKTAGQFLWDAFTTAGNWLLEKVEKIWNFFKTMMKVAKVSLEIVADNIPGFSDGGYTGNAGVNDVAGVVHGQEYVFNAAAVRRWGVAALQSLAAGIVPPSMQTVQAVGQTSGGGLADFGKVTLVDSDGAQIPVLMQRNVYDETVKRQRQKNRASGGKQGRFAT